MHPRERRDLLLIGLLTAAVAGVALVTTRPDPAPRPGWAEGPPPQPEWLHADSTTPEWRPAWQTPVSQPTVELVDSGRVEE